MTACAGFIQDEYFQIVKQVAEFDNHLFIVKGWGVTFGLATLVLAFQKKSAGLFLVAALSGLCFWLLEAQLKAHQMRYYPRMRSIEVACADVRQTGAPIAPLIDWSWDRAEAQLEGKPDVPQKLEERGRSVWYRWRLFLPSVLLPHALTFVFGAVAALLVMTGRLPKLFQDKG